ncbi:hypothetical protein E3N88_02115 [Mikania micrantha]|uniref:Uncharacterized protein n=1 Tax=Mikania micrantha TaxID=192012 RepID=A0A5N6Q344_9ASTR|nr:hypothetical protein E3N88_02115 [Mikania micrantha]
MLAITDADPNQLPEKNEPDTATPRVLSILSFVLERLVNRNEMLSSNSGSGRLGKNLEMFHGIRPPAITIPKHYNNAFYARVGGVTNAELNRLELEFLFMLDFDLTVTTRVFESYCLYLEREMIMWDGTKLKNESGTRTNTIEDIAEISVEDMESFSSSLSNGGQT